MNKKFYPFSAVEPPDLVLEGKDILTGDFVVGISMLIDEPDGREFSALHHPRLVIIPPENSNGRYFFVSNNAFKSTSAGFAVKYHVVRSV